MTLSARGKGFPPTWLEVWVAPGAEINITGNDKMIRTWDVKSNVPQQKELNSYNEQTRDYVYHIQLIAIRPNSTL